MHSQFWRTIAWPVLVLSTSGFGGWGHFNWESITLVCL
jgi:hypothetical protein